MKRDVLLFLTAILGLAFVVSGAQARGKITTKYRYYNVTGKTAKQLHKAIIVPNGLFDSRKEYANITIVRSLSGKLVQGKSCRLKNFAINAAYTVKLPRLRRGAFVPAKLRRQFKQFLVFLRHHELRHRTIWNRCLARTETKVSRLRYKKCNTLDRKAAAIIIQEWKKCGSRQAAFDRSERKHVYAQALVRAALGKVRTKTASKRIKKRKRRSIVRP